MEFIFGEELWGACPSCDAVGQHDTSSSVMCIHVTFCNYVFMEPGVNFTGCEYVVPFVLAMNISIIFLITIKLFLDIIIILSVFV